MHLGPGHYLSLPPPPICMPTATLPSTTATISSLSSTASLASSPLHTQPPLVRRDALINQEAPTEPQRLALVNDMTDKEISEAGLVRKLEQMREAAEWGRRRERGKGGASGSKVDLVTADADGILDSGHGNGSSTHGHGDGDGDINIDMHLQDYEWDGWDEWDVGKDMLGVESQKERERERNLERSRSILDDNAHGG